MSVYWNSRTKNLSPYIPGEQPKDRQFIKLNTNENPYPPSPKVIEAIKRAADDSLRLYPDPGCSEFREAVAARYNARPEQVFAGNGSDEILAFAFGAFFESGTKAQPILFPDITYSFYPVYAGLWHIPYRTIPLDNNFCINTSGYKINSGGVVFPNPNAPTGMALPLNDIFSLAEYLEQQGKVFILDEAYIDFGAAAGAETAIPHINNHKNLLIVHTLSKSASLAGLRVGFAIGSEELIEGLCRIRDSFNSYTLDRLAMAGAAAAVSDSAYYDGINRRVIATRERVGQALRDIGCTVLPSAANFIFMKAPGNVQEEKKLPQSFTEKEEKNIKTLCSSVVYSSSRIGPCISGAAFFSALRERGIIVRHFNRDRIADYLRVSIGTDEEMDVFLEECSKIVGSW
jgi:histidinol-phosphate aminotransferase